MKLGSNAALLLGDFQTGFDEPAWATGGGRNTPRGQGESRRAARRLAGKRLDRLLFERLEAERSLVSSDPEVTTPDWC